MTRLPEDWHVMSPEEKAEFWEYVHKEQEEAERSYQPSEKRVYCFRCGRLLKKGSVSFFEGFHMDVCD